jgi:hypothetical protein
MRWGFAFAFALIAVVVVAASGGCTRNRTPAEPLLVVKSGDETVKGPVMVGQPLRLVANWTGSCERYSMSGDKEHPMKGSWSEGSCNEVSTFDIEVKCSLRCYVGRIHSEQNTTVWRDVIPEQAGDLQLEILYTSPFHHDRRVTYGATVRAPKSIALLGCGNEPRISLDALLLGPPGGAAAIDSSGGAAVTAPPIHCVKVDNDEDDGPIRVVAVTTDDQEMPMAIFVGNEASVTDLQVWKIEQMFKPAAPYIYEVRVGIMGRAVDLQIDMRGRRVP